MDEKFENYLTIFFSLCLRTITALYNYSGFRNGPINGDFEAQRHWMEITTKLSINDWYKNTTDNNLLYWGLDYPPLTAYHSFVVGKISEFIDPSWTELHKSRGLENVNLKIFMRVSVLLGDLLLFMPVLFFYSKLVTKRARSLFLFYSLISPSFILIDHGHFQYNNISLGFYIFSVLFLIKENFIIASILFCCSITYKQMELYHSIPIFCFILSKCLRNKCTGLVKLFGVSLTVIISFVVIFSPYLSSHEEILLVIKRIFPVKRGLFEDKVSNFWCITNILIKWTKLFSNIELFQVSTGVTLITTAPACLFLLAKPTKKIFLYTSCVVSLGFFLFSFQVHEKTILIPLMSALLNFESEPDLAIWFSTASSLSLYPLMIKDDLIIPSLVISTIFLLFWAREFEIKNDQLSKKIFSLNILFLFLFASIVIYFAIFAPPPKYPDLQSLLISTVSFGQFFFFFTYYYYRLSVEFVTREKVE